MPENDPTKKLSPLTMRNDVPVDAREAIASAIADISTPLSTDVWIYRAVVGVLGLTLLVTVIGGIALAFVGKGDATIRLPDAVVALGSAAVGALAGLLAPSPVTRGNRAG